MWRSQNILIAWFRSLVGKQCQEPQAYRAARCVTVMYFQKVTSDPPPMHWAPCHPLTIRRFKASMTCPHGHGLTLCGHTIAQNGDVSPSVVCPFPGCSFHEYVRLDRWSFGALP
jgi:hypothetical protein